MWGPTAPQPAYDFYGSSARYAYGTLYSGGYGGVLHAYDIKTGKLKWTYTLSEIGHESPYGNYPIEHDFIADGKIFIHSTEHSPTQPLWRGSYLRCINATDGTEIWKILNFVSGAAIADGYVVAGNNYDNRMYAYGKGPSATTVVASPKVSKNGDSVLIEGTITDQCAGAKDSSEKLGYVNGVPAVSDADMQAWMEYLYMQQSCPTDAKGVPVHLTAIDPNNNYQDIGTFISDIDGTYAINWKPPVPGVYKVTATFAGSESYSSSAGTAYFLVEEAPSAAVVTPTPATTATPAVPSQTPSQTTSPSASPSQAPPPATADMTTTYVAVAAAITVIGVAAAAVVLRRRK